jgi:hypothetical protein
MQITLDRTDLRPEHYSIPVSEAEYKHFEQRAQAAIRINGFAVFKAPDGYTFNRIYAPDKKDE